MARTNRPSSSTPSSDAVGAGRQPGAARRARAARPGGVRSGGIASLDALMAVADGMGRAPSLETALDEALAAVLKALGLEIGAIHLLGEDVASARAASTPRP